MTPLVSVIIPTANRPRYLPRAVESALAGMQPGEVEVIVVPNGPDQSWRESLRDFAANPQIRIEPIEKAHACAARNHGLSVAKGGAILFLDDDDYIYPGAISRMLNQLDANNADICSADVDLVDEKEKLLRQWRQPEETDFVAAILGPSRPTLSMSHLYRRDILENHLWDESLPVRQVSDWMLRLCATPGIRWIKLPESVAAWVQHGGTRITRGTDPGPAALRHTADTIINVVNKLRNNNMLTQERKTAAADGLWSAFQKGFMYEPVYWRAIARHAESLAPGRRPPSKIYRSRLTKKIDPVLLTIVLTPLRWLYYRGLRRFLS